MASAPRPAALTSEKAYRLKISASLRRSGKSRAEVPGKVVGVTNDG